MASLDPAEVREQHIRQLIEEHAPFILDTLRRAGVRADVAKDLAQEVELILRAHVEEERALPSPRGFLTRVIRFVVKNHNRFEGRRANAGVDVDVLRSPDPDPERQAQKDELWAKVVRYLAVMPEAEADAVFDIEMMGDSLDEVAAKLDLPLTTVASIRDRGLETLREMARRSKQETEMGVRRRRIAAAKRAAQKKLAGKLAG